ncbi:hypothetical protein AB0H45_34590 [Streptomyces atroolivaceus]|uniref:hypothetical protein n=1 Tax=Streptomyces atroolivaceus TaxID=66869 RepID=UPI003406479B
MVEGVAVGQWLANLRKAGGLGKDEERAAQRRAALENIDLDWYPAWSIEWQRHYATARTLLSEEWGLTEVLPGASSTAATSAPGSTGNANTPCGRTCSPNNASDWKGSG